MGNVLNQGQVTISPINRDVESVSDESSEDSTAKPTKSWKGYIWDTWDLPPDQRWLLFKVDAFVLTFASIGYFLKNIDQTNVNNAFLSGMEEDLQMFGNQLVTSMLFLVTFYLFPEEY
jgi:ACS family pantothenate transporter-like MFS transporter